MGSNAAVAEYTPNAVSLTTMRDESAWLSWLRDHTDLNWRPGQWDPELWLFTCSPDDPTTLAATCAVVNCSVIILHGKLCQTCAKALKQSGLDVDEFVKSYRRPRPRLTTAQRSNPARCAVEVNGCRCPSTGAVRGLCETHYRQWNKRTRRSPKISFEEWMATGEATIPDEPLPDCIVPACRRESMTSATKVCRLHWARYMRGGRAEPVPIWARRQLPHIGRHQFILLNLPERLRWEVLYAVQQRAGRGGRVDAGNTKAVVRIMEAHPSLATMSKAEVDRIAHGHNMNVRVHLHQFARVLRNAYDASLGRSAKDALVWDLDDVGFEPQPNGRRPRPRRRKCLDFGLITQPWLRDLALAWAREESQSYLIVKTHRAAVVASQALESRSDRGQDITALGNRDVDAIAAAVRLLTRVDNGAPCQTSFKRHIFAVFFDLINWGRRHGLLDGLPASFEPTRTRLHLPADPVVEKAGKAIPEAVQRQLDAQTDSLGRGFTHGMLTAEQTHQMFLTAYIVLRDTGRRTLEVASLRTNCLTRDAAGPVLIYDNHKARRPGRRLPILQSTADAINDMDRGAQDHPHVLAGVPLPRHHDRGETPQQQQPQQRHPHMGPRPRDADTVTRSTRTVTRCRSTDPRSTRTHSATPTRSGTPTTAHPSTFCGSSWTTDRSKQRVATTPSPLTGREAPSRRSASSPSTRTARRHHITAPRRTRCAQSQCHSATASNRPT